MLAPQQNSSRGIATIMVIGLLCILGTMAVCFIQVTNVERQAAANHLHRLEAYLAAQAGLSKAVRRLRADALKRTYAHPQDEWVFHGATRQSSGAGVAIEESKYPSYWWIGNRIWQDGTSKPEPVLVHGQPVSGILHDQTHTYVLKIFDVASQLDLNSANAHLATILNNLGSIMQYYQGYDPVQGKGLAILELRRQHGGRFHSKEEIAAVIGWQNYLRLRDYVTVHAWVDPTTIQADTTRGPGYFLPEPRAPVNINTAPRPLLVAMLYGLSNGVESIDFATAVQITEEIVKFRNSRDPIEGAFIDWNQFDSFIDSLCDNPVIHLTATQAAIIKANANPNVNLKRFNPDGVIYPSVDKTELPYYTHEFSFSSTGIYEIICQGRLNAPDGRLLSNAEIESVVTINGFFRHNAQSEFEPQKSSTLANHTDTFPNNVHHRGHLPAEYMGYVQLITNVTDVVAPEDLTFMADYKHSLAPDQAVGSPVMYGSKCEDLALTEGGDMAPDGVLFNAEQDKQLVYDSLGNLPLEEGVLTFWLKYNRNRNIATTPVFYSCNPITSETGVQMEIRCSVTAGTIYLIATRLFYVKSSYTPASERAAYPIPYQHEKTEVVVTLGKTAQVHEWFHVAVSWWDGTNLEVRINGKPVGQKISVLTSEWKAYTGVKLYDPRFYVGGYVDADGTPLFKNLTIDDVRIYRDRSMLDKMGVPSRYEPADAQYLGLFLSAFPEQHYDITLGPITWTVRYPKSQGGQEIPYWLIPSIMTSLGKEVRETPTYVPGYDDEDLQMQQDLEKLTQKYMKLLERIKKIQHHRWRLWRNWHRRHHLKRLQRWLDWVQKRIQKLKERFDKKKQKVLKGRKPGGELDALVSNEGLFYEIRFVEGEQGLPKPLNVTPVIDDITITWQGPVKFLTFNTRP